MAEGIVHRILAPTFVDGPGARMAVFLQGCDLACPTCHNPETRGTCDACGRCLEACAQHALARDEGRIRHLRERCVDCGICEQVCPSSSTPRTVRMMPEALLERALRWSPFLEGVTFSGGEASLQAVFIQTAGALMKERLGWTWLVDTHGGMSEATFAALLAAADGFLFDLKALDPVLHHRLTGRPIGQALSNLCRAAEAGKLMELRLLLLPGATAEPEPFEDMLAFAAGLPGIFPLRLLAYRHHGVRGRGLESPELTADILGQRRETAIRILGETRVIASTGK